MEGVQEQRCVGEAVLGSVRERPVRFDQRDSLLAQQIQVGRVGDASQGQDDLQRRQGQVSRQPAAAAAQLAGRGTIARGYAAYGGGDVEVAQTQTIVTVRRVGLTGEAEPVQGRVKEVRRW